MLRDQWRRSQIGSALLLATLMFSSLLFAPSAFAQADACSRPSGPVAQIICDDPDLADLDLAMGDAFRQHIRNSPRAQRRIILRSQRDWLQIRNDCLSAADRRECLRYELESRITDLSQGLAGSVNSRRDQGLGPDPQTGFDDSDSFGGFDTTVNPAPRGTAQPPLADPFSDPFSNQPLQRGNPRQGSTVPQGARDLVRQRALPTIDGEGATVPGATSGNNPGTPRSLPLPPRMGGPTPQTGGIVGGPLKGGAATTDGSAPATPASESANGNDAAKTDGKTPQQIIEFLSSSVWRAEIASGIRPGTIFIFQPNGILVTADCVEAYNIGKWRVEGAGLRLEDGSKRDLAGDILESGPGFVRLKLTPKGKSQSLDIVFRAARGPFACTSSR